MEEGFEVVNLSASGVIPTPNIRTNGNWFVGNKDTGVAAKGETGEKGDQGIQGEKGDQGEKGTDADTSELERLSNEVDTINQRLAIGGVRYVCNDSISVANGSSIIYSPHDANDYFSYVNGIFTCKKAGYYSFSVGVHGLVKANDFLIIGLNGLRDSNFGTSITGIAIDTQFKTNIHVTEYVHLNDTFRIVITSKNGNTTPIYGRGVSLSTGIYIKPLLVE